MPAFIVFLQILRYQNVPISIFSPGMSSNSYAALSGTSFIGAVALAGPFLVYLLRSGASRVKLAFSFSVGVEGRTTLLAITIALLIL